MTHRDIDDLLSNFGRRRLVDVSVGVRVQGNLKSVNAGISVGFEAIYDRILYVKDWTPQASLF